MSMGMASQERREVRQGRYSYLIDDVSRTAWISRVRMGRWKWWRAPKTVVVGGVEYVVDSIEIGVGCCNRHLRRIVLGDNVLYVDRDSFQWCENLHSVYLGKGVECVSSWHFAGSGNVLQSLRISKDNPHLKRVPGGMIINTQGAVVASGNMCGFLVPDKVVRIAEFAFSCNQKMSWIRLSNSLVEIGSYAFFESRKLRKVLIPEGVSMIGSSAFSDCDELEFVDMPSSVSNMGSNVFDNSHGLKTLILRSPARVFGPSSLGLCCPGCVVYAVDALTKVYAQLLGANYVVLPLSML